MSEPLEQPVPISTTAVSCGRSWDALLERRCDAFAQAVSLLGASIDDSSRVVTEFLEFFDETGIELFRDEEEWIFRALRPTPAAVIRALEEHIQISRLIISLIGEAQAGCTDLRVVHTLGSLFLEHLLCEEAHVRPLLSDRPSLILTR